MARVCFPDVLIHHSPGGAHLAGNNTSRFKQMGALKGDGMRVGFPDLICLWNGQAAFMEVKRLKGSVISDEQQEMLLRLYSLGFMARIVRSVEEAHALLKTWGAPCKAELS